MMALRGHRYNFAEAMERDGVDLASVTLDYLEDVGSLP
jgi:hypothetical protein